jgi:hypothetical protein
MNSKTIGAKLNNMKGKSFEYAKQIHTVTQVSIDTDKEEFTIKTDKNSFTRKFENAEAFLKYWYEQPENLAIEKAAAQLPKQQELQHPEAVFASNALSNELINILKDNIEKVSKNATYINQAKAVDKSVDTILKVKKLQLEMYKAINSK